MEVIQKRPVIRTKALMYEGVERNWFGNYPINWSSLEAVLASGYTGEVSIRSREIANPVRLYHVPVAELAEKIAALPPSQRNSGLMFSESPPDQHRRLQGEWDGYYLFYSRVPKPMRYALDEGGVQLVGPAARLYLRHALLPESYEHILQVEEDFPGHVIEFSEFSRQVGRDKTNLFIWEVRMY